MPASTSRRPVPALAFLLALTVLTAIVWWRVLHRDETNATTTGTVKTTQAPTCTPQGAKIVLPKPSSVTVKVRNGAGRDGLAGSVLSQLKSRGFATSTKDTITSQAELTTLATEVAEIRFGPSGKNAATLLSYYFTGSKLVPISRSDASVDVVLGKKFGNLAPQSKVAAAQAKVKKTCKS
jgi:hypothetical protein